MAISPLEIQKGSILLHEGKVKKVRAIGDFIQFEGTKEWVGGSMIEGEPLGDKWFIDLGFEFVSNHVPFEGPSAKVFKKGTFLVQCLSDQYFMYYESGPGRRIEYLHQLQLICFAETGQHLKIPKLPK